MEAMPARALKCSKWQQGNKTTNGNKSSSINWQNKHQPDGKSTL